MDLLKKLEEIKQLGFYDVSFYYGEGIGCDDLEVHPSKRKARFIGVPVGCIGSAKIMYLGKIEDFLEFNFMSKPKTISNPPSDEECENDGYYIWGTEEGLDAIESWFNPKRL